MPLYKFECDACGTQDLQQMTFEEHDAYRTRFPEGHNTVHSGCVNGRFQQVLDFHFARGMSEHYSTQLDMPISSDRQFKSELSRHQDEYSQRMGYDVKFETVDPNDKKALNVTDVGLESQERASHNAAADGHKSTFS